MPRDAADVRSRGLHEQRPSPDGGALGRGEEPKRAAALVEELEAAGGVAVTLHRPSADGRRGPLGAQRWVPGTPTSGEGVRTRFMGSGFDVVDLP